MHVVDGRKHQPRRDKGTHLLQAVKEKIKIRIPYCTVAYGRELIELCTAAIPAHNTSNGLLLSLGKPTAAKILSKYHQPFICSELRILKGSLIIYVVGGRTPIQQWRVIFFGVPVGAEHLPRREKSE